MIYFFFSSRRRHTRCLSDWSSDVCSSDLLPADKYRHNQGGKYEDICSLTRQMQIQRSFKIGSWTCKPNSVRLAARSEERRVGKECRSRWWPCQYKKK